MTIKKICWLAMVPIWIGACDDPGNTNTGNETLNCDFGGSEIQITEIYTDRRGSDNAEWVELLNTSDRVLQLNRSVLTVNTRHWIINTEKTLAPNIRFVIANRNGKNADYVDTGLNLPNQQASVFFRCQHQVITPVDYRFEKDQGSYGLGIGPRTLGMASDNHDWCQQQPSPGTENDACGIRYCREQQTPGTLRQSRPPSQGDIRINELFANPSGADTGREWLELYRTHDGPMDLNGLLLEQTYGDGKSRRWRIAQPACLPVDQSFTLVAFIESTAIPGMAPAVTVSGDPIYNGPSTWRLWWEDTEIDRIDFPESPDNTSLIRDGDTRPEVCAERRVFHDGLASPAAANTVCGPACLDNGNWRPLRHPGPGDVLINEVMLDAAGSDQGKEWVELYITAESIDLNQTIIAHTRHDDLDTLESDEYAIREFSLDDRQCLTVVAGEHIVIGEPAHFNASTVDLTLALQLFNSQRSTTLSLKHDTGVIDEAVLPSPVAGRSVNLDLHRLEVDLSHTVNDDEARFCHARTLFNEQEQGTPGKPNEPCGAYCLANGTWREIQPPAAGDLAISEVFNRPLPDRPLRRWLEIYGENAVPVDLNGLRIQSWQDPAHSRFDVGLDPAPCMAVAPGEVVVLAEKTHDAITEPNPDVHPVLELDELDFYLQSSQLALIYDETVVDQATLPDGETGTVSYLNGESISPGMDNDSPLNWCLATDASTPGMLNPPCAPAP